MIPFPWIILCDTLPASQFLDYHSSDDLYPLLIAASYVHDHFLHLDITDNYSPSSNFNFKLLALQGISYVFSSFSKFMPCSHNNPEWVFQVREQLSFIQAPSFLWLCQSGQFVVSCIIQLSERGKKCMK